MHFCSFRNSCYIFATEQVKTPGKRQIKTSRDSKSIVKNPSQFLATIQIGVTMADFLPVQPVRFRCRTILGEN